MEPAVLARTSHAMHRWAFALVLALGSSFGCARRVSQDPERPSASAVSAAPLPSSAPLAPGSLASASLASVPPASASPASASLASAPAATVEPTPAFKPPLPWVSREAQGSATTRVFEWSLDTPALRAVVLVPRGADEGQRYPVLVALHGRGEALKGPAAGAWGWPKDYALLRAVDRLAAPPLTARDLEGFAPAAQLEALNRTLAQRPYRGLIVVCPYVPDLDLKVDRDALEYGRLLVDVLLPHVREATPALPSANATSIDGVSLGGFTALVVGLANPEAFGAVSGIQPALQPSQITEWVEKARAARARSPKLALRLLTSDDDFFRGVVTRTSQALTAAGVRHEYRLVAGPHDYAFNRGPGAYELLVWNDAVLRGE